uniref:Ovule protein n=1 Tax=Parastrongyloides trichosuri TaxID=131310 RepID=A0A0N5A6Y9_PARTI
GSCSYKEKELIRRYFIPLSLNKNKSLFSFIKMRFNSHCKSTSFKLLESEIVLMSNPDLY